MSNILYIIGWGAAQPSLRGRAGRLSLRYDEKGPGPNPAEGFPSVGFGPGPTGVSNGTRTRDIRHHKPALYQLSYTHHVSPRREATE